MAQKKHIALFVRSFEGSGGAERVFLNLAFGLITRGHRVDLVMARCKGHFLDQIPPEIKIVDLNARSARASLRVIHKMGRDTWFWMKMVLTRKPHYVLGALPGLTDYLRKERPDALIASMDYPNAMQIGHKKCQTGSSSQFLACWLHVTNFQFAFTINFVILCHTVLHLLGYALWLILLCGYCNNIRKILTDGELFLTKNRSA